MPRNTFKSFKWFKTFKPFSEIDLGFLRDDLDGLNGAPLPRYALRATRELGPQNPTVLSRQRRCRIEGYSPTGLLGDTGSSVILSSAKRVVKD